MDHFDGNGFQHLDAATELPNSYAFDVDGYRFELSSTVDSTIPDQLMVDWDDDGRADVLMQWEQSSNGGFTQTTLVDTNGDGSFDLAEVDLDGDFWPDIVAVVPDASNGEIYIATTSDTGAAAFLEASSTSGLDAWAEIDSMDEFAASAEAFHPAEVVSLSDTNGLAGTKTADRWSEQWHQQESTTSCAVCCQEFIIEAATGRELLEDELVSLAIDLGVYSEEGTYPKDMGALLDQFGVANTLQPGLDLDELLSLVSNGHGVTVAVDSSELYGGDNWDEVMGIPGSGQDHAIQVIGYDSGTDGNYLIVNDPGRADGSALRVSAASFLNAWDDSGNFACVTDERILA